MSIYTTWCKTVDELAGDMAHVEANLLTVVGRLHMFTPEERHQARKLLAPLLTHHKIEVGAALRDTENLYVEGP